MINCKILAVPTIVEEEGLTPAVWENGGAGKNKREYLRFEVSRDYMRVRRYQKKLYTMLNTTCILIFVSDLIKNIRSKRRIAACRVTSLKPGLSLFVTEENQLLQK